MVMLPEAERRPQSTQIQWMSRSTSQSSGLTEHQQASLHQDAAQPLKHVLILHHFQLPTAGTSTATWYNTATLRTRVY